MQVGHDVGGDGLGFGCNTGATPSDDRPRVRRRPHRHTLRVSHRGHTRRLKRTLLRCIVNGLKNIQRMCDLRLNLPDKNQPNKNFLCKSVEVETSVLGFVLPCKGSGVIKGAREQGVTKVGGGRCGGGVHWWWD